MQVFIIIGILFFSPFSWAIEGKFSPYSCDYVKLPEEKSWLKHGISFNSEFSAIGWNQAGRISQFMVKGRTSGEFGTCSEITTTGARTSLNIYFVEGKDLDFAASACAYSGKNVDYKTHSVDIESYDSYTHAITTQNLNGQSLDFLHIAGVRSEDVDVISLCDEAFEKVGGRLSDLQSSKSLRLEKSYRAL